MFGSSGGLNLRVSTVQALDWRDWEKVQISVSADTLWAGIWTRNFSLIRSRSFLPLVLLLKWLNLSGDTNILTRSTDFQGYAFPSFRAEVPEDRGNFVSSIAKLYQNIRCYNL